MLATASTENSKRYTTMRHVLACAGCMQLPTRPVLHKDQLCTFCVVKTVLATAGTKNAKRYTTIQHVLRINYGHKVTADSTASEIKY